MYKLGVLAIELISFLLILPSGHSKIPKDMVRIKGCTYLMGAEAGVKRERPVHKVMLKSFWMDKYDITVAEFERFVRTTDYKTEAEKQGWAIVFTPDPEVSQKVVGADWRHPEGPVSTAIDLHLLG